MDSPMNGRLNHNQQKRPHEEDDDDESSEAGMPKRANGNPSAQQDGVNGSDNGRFKYTPIPLPLNMVTQHTLCNF